MVTPRTATQCWVVVQHFQGYQPEMRLEYSDSLHSIGPNDPTLVVVHSFLWVHDSAVCHATVCKSRLAALPRL